MNKKIKIASLIIGVLLVIGFIIVFVNHDIFMAKKEIKTINKEKPVIVASDYEINQGEEFNLEDQIKCSYKKKKIKCNIEGSYDKNTPGDYKIKIIAISKDKTKSSKRIVVSVKENIEEEVNQEENKVIEENNTNKNPYYVEVIRNQNVVIVYGLDNSGNYTKVVKVFVSSVGKDNGTPTGTFTTTDKYIWRALFGGVYGQYATRITGSILFHSVPYTAQSKDSLEWDEYNKLGEAASLGCVRMAVSDVKWIYDNCPSGMTVKIYDGDIPAGITKPTSIKIDANSPNKGWDPTDPDSNNPWK